MKKLLAAAAIAAAPLTMAAHASADEATPVVSLQIGNIPVRIYPSLDVPDVWCFKSDYYLASGWHRWYGHCEYIQGHDLKIRVHVEGFSLNGFWVNYNGPWRQCNGVDSMVDTLDALHTAYTDFHMQSAPDNIPGGC